MKRFLFIIVQCIAFTAIAQSIKLNQLGFNIDQTKIAIVPDLNETTFSIVDAVSNEIVFEKQLGKSANWSESGENVQIADFTEFNTEGSYKVIVGNSQSYLFEISNSGAYDNIAKWILKGFYLWRASTAIEEQYAQFEDINYARNAGHPDNVVYVHSSAASDLRPEGTVLSAPKGWYDAGDYNKYVVNASPAVYPMLLAYTNYPEYFKIQNLAIPESDNTLPDILDEVKWEIDWLLAMQDPNDGGVYTKLTSKAFCGEIQPEDDHDKRFVVAKSTAAALDFAAMLAKASTVFNEFIPEYSAQCLEAAKKAYAWAELNPAIYFTNPSDISTGGYGDNNVSDERFWANVELFIATNDETYLSKISKNQSFGIPSWVNVNTYGLLSIASMADTLKMPQDDKDYFMETFRGLADDLETGVLNSPYKIVANDFYWGSNGDVASRGMLLAYASKVFENTSYFEASFGAFDYLLGRNPTGYSFVTMFGKKYPKHIHDRRSTSDIISEPLPGYLAGGPNPDNTAQDCGTSMYPSTLPAKAYLDEFCSYSTNEIAINWNGPLVYLVSAIDNAYKKKVDYILSGNTNDDGSEIILIKSGKTKGTILKEGIEVRTGTSIHLVDTVLNSPESDTIIIKLNSIINADDDTISVAFAENVLEYNGIQNELFSIAIKNTTANAAPFVLSAVMQKNGKSITVTFNKEITAILQDSIHVYASGENILDSISLLEDRIGCELYTQQIFQDMAVAIYLKPNAVIGKIGARGNVFERFIVENNAPKAPPIPISAEAPETGEEVVVVFSDAVYALQNVTGLSLIEGSGNYVSADYRFTKNMLIFSPEERIISRDSLSVVYNGEGLVSKEDFPVESFVIATVTNKTPPMQDTIVIQHGDSVAVQNENFSYNFGFIVEDCSDTGGGKNLGYTDVGDWADYIVDVKETGAYAIHYRTAANTTTGIVGLYSITNNGEKSIKTTTLKRTGGWQSWTTVTDLVELEEGIQYFRLKAVTDLYNLNYFSFTDTAGLGLGIPPVQPSTSIGENENAFVFPTIVQPNSVLTYRGKINSVEYEIFSANGIFIQKGALTENQIKIGNIRKGAYIIKLYNREECSSIPIVVN